MSGVEKCEKVNCFNKRTGHECWRAIHPDGSMTYGWIDRNVAESMAVLDYGKVIRSNPLRKYPTC